jgi:hypothetical protein
MTTIKVNDPEQALLELGAVTGLDLLGPVPGDPRARGPRA